MSTDGDYVRPRPLYGSSPCKGCAALGYEEHNPSEPDIPTCWRDDVPKQGMKERCEHFKQREMSKKEIDDMWWLMKL